jgi:hypothetical protein
VCIHRVEKRVAGETIRSPWEVSSRRIVRTTVTTYAVVTGVPEVGIIDAELSVIENVESLCTELHFTAFVNLKVLQQRHVKVQAAWIIQKISAGIAKRQATRCNEFVGISEKRTEAADIRSQSYRGWVR